MWHAIGFLNWCGIWVPPSTCPKCTTGEHWTLSVPKNDGNPYLWCKRPLEGGEVRDPALNEHGAPRKKLKFCSKKTMWRKIGQQDSPLAERLPKLTPIQLIQLIYSFAMMVPRQFAAYDSGVHPTTVGDVYFHFRDILASYMSKHQRSAKIGGPGRIVCVDETHFCKKPKNRGG